MAPEQPPQVMVTLNSYVWVDMMCCGLCAVTVGRKKEVVVLDSFAVELAGPMRGRLDWEGAWKGVMSLGQKSE